MQYIAATQPRWGFQGQCKYSHAYSQRLPINQIMLESEREITSDLQPPRPICLEMSECLSAVHSIEASSNVSANMLVRISCFDHFAKQACPLKPNATMEQLFYCTIWKSPIADPAAVFPGACTLGKQHTGQAWSSFPACIYMPFRTMK